MNRCIFKELEPGLQRCEVCEKLARHGNQNIYSECRGAPLPKGPGPGARLTKLLARFGFKYTPDCQCANRANLMDSWGPAKCARRIDTIVEWMQEEARQRGLPLPSIVARSLITLAIRQSR